MYLLIPTHLNLSSYYILMLFFIHCRSS